jgi:hypothetical protein
MRHIERGPAPPLVRSPEFQRLWADYRSFRASGGSRVTQTRLGSVDFVGMLEPLAGDYVRSLFRGRCAYTERDGRLVLHLHRPESDAFDDRLGVSAEHYWWTAGWHRNWYAASYELVGLKRTTFPVLGDRALVPPPDVVSPRWEPSPPYLDEGVLLDPCEDHPEWHLRFHRDGTVTPWADEETAVWLGDDDRRRGAETIRLLGLDADDLVRSRAAAIGEVVGRGDVEVAPLETLPHVGAIRQVLAQLWLERGADPRQVSDLLPEMAPLLLSQPHRHPDGLMELVLPHVAAIYPALADSWRPREQLAGSAPPEAAPQGVVPPPEARPARPHRKTRPRRGLTAEETHVIPRTAAITKATIVNFQAIERVELTIPVAEVELPPRPGATTTETGRAWTALLGENGTGKSSTLRAIGLGLASLHLPDLEQEVDLDWSRLLRRGTRSGRVLLEFTDGSRIDLRFNARRAWFVGGAPRVEAFVRGFGATRLLSPDAPPPEDHVRLGNLFDAHVPVIDAEQWLLDIPSEGDFNVVALAVAELIGRREGVEFTPADPTAQPLVQREGGELTIGGEPLDTLSDGYRTMIATACDLMAGAGAGLSDMRNASGIVLVDELGAHMHPRWKMDITGTLRRVFPSMQFIVTTHEPLCLLGLVENEVIRVRPSATRPGALWHAVFDPVPDSPSRFRVDRLLTSSFFGLDTTIDPGVDREFREYYALLRRDVLTPEQERRRNELRGRLSQHGVLGYTRRDQLVYEAIDRFLADEPELGVEERRHRRDETLEEVADIWRNVAERRRAGGLL